jgi:integrase
MIRERKDRNGLQVQVYAGRDQLTGRKRYVSRQVPGSGRTAMRQAKQVEAQLLAEVAAGKHQRSAMTLAQLLDEWLAWRERNGKPISPATLHNYRLTTQTKIKPGLGHLPVTNLDARVLDRFYVVTVMNGASVRPQRSSR